MEYRVKILRYRVEYDYTVNPAGVVNIMIIGGREIVMSNYQSNPLHNHSKILLIPYLESKRNEIVGAQLLILNDNVNNRR